MKTFKEYKKSREKYLYSNMVKENDNSYRLYEQHVLAEFDVMSPTELSRQEHQEYLRKMSQFNLNESKIEQRIPKYKMRRNTQNRVQEIVDSCDLEYAQKTLHDLFEDKEDSFIGSKLNGNSIILDFGNSSYKFTKMNESEITSQAEFEDWLKTRLEYGHGEDFDNSIFQKMVKDLMKKYNSNWGAMVGAVKNG